MLCTTSVVAVKHSLIQYDTYIKHTMKLHNFTSGIPLSVLIINFTRQFRYIHSMPHTFHIYHHFQSIKPNLNVTLAQQHSFKYYTYVLDLFRNDLPPNKIGNSHPYHGYVYCYFVLDDTHIVQIIL